MRKRLKREYRGLPTSLEGVTLTVVKAIPMGKGEKLMPGTDVTSEARSWRNLRMLLLRGYLTANPPVNAMRVVPVGSEPTPSSPPKAAKSDQPVALADLSFANTKREIRAALEAAGLDVPSTLSKSEMLNLIEGSADE